MRQSQNPVGSAFHRRPSPRTAVERRPYLDVGNRISTTDARSNTIHRTYDPFGRILSEWGATYPVRYTYGTSRGGGAKGGFLSIQVNHGQRSKSTANLT